MTNHMSTSMPTTTTTTAVPLGDDAITASPLIDNNDSSSSGSGDSGSDDDDDDDEYHRAVDEAVAADIAKRHTTRRLRRYAVAAIGYIIGAVLVVGGVTEMIAAEAERRSGWSLGACHVVHDFGHNDSECLYFGARPVGATTQQQGGPFCAVPAAIAASTSFAHPPACHRDTDPADVAHWRSIRPGTDVECLVPAATHYTVRLSTCIAATTGGHSVTAIVWRTWVERLVYLTRTPREGTAAVEAITSLRTKSGIGLIVAGTLAMAVVTVCVCYCCRPPSPTAVARRRYSHRMAAHKMY